VLLAVLLGSAAPPTRAEPGDTTWVHTYHEDFINWATPHDSTFTFPDTTVHYSKVVLFYKIGCPAAPGDCDPWDRLGYLKMQHGADWYEIARVVTPYDITPAPRPVTCTWPIDVSDYEPYLHGDVTLSNYIESWIGGNRGWLVTIDFAFIEGEPDWLPYQVVNLWQTYYTVYGDPNNPIESHLAAMRVPIDPAAGRVKFRAIVTGHGQGNTDNCAEFCPRSHSLTADASTFSHTLWRSDCNTNPCSPQGGTWTYARAGWCPGSSVAPWDVELSSAVTPGTEAVLDYNIQPYTNYCRPSPDCVSGVTCTDCNYNYNGHTEPIYAVASHLVYYRRNPVMSVINLGASTPGLEMRGAPNPFTPPSAIRYALARAGTVTVRIVDAAGRVVREVLRGSESAGEQAWIWDGRDTGGRAVPAGVYFCEVRSGSESVSTKMLIVR
jgi:hypothetical protein